MLSYKEVIAVREALLTIAPRFESTNPIPVEKATVPATEWLALTEALQALVQGVVPLALAAEKHQHLTCGAFVKALTYSGVIEQSSSSSEKYVPGDRSLNTALAQACKLMCLSDVSDAKLSELFGGY